MQATLVTTCLPRRWDSCVDVVNPAARVTVFAREFWVVAALCAVPCGSALAQQAQSRLPLTLTEARAMARRTHPTIVAAREVVAGAEGLERQAGAFQNPTVSFAREQTSGNGGTNWQNIVTFGQPIDIGGQIGARRAAARDRRAAVEAQLAVAETQLDFEVGRAYVLALAADDRAARTAEAAAVFSRAREIGAARLEQGDISGYEYRRIGLEAGRYAALQAEMTLARDAARLALATMIAPSTDAISALAARLQLDDSVVTAPVNASLDSLLASAFRSRSDLRAADFYVDASIADARLAGRQAIPTPTVALGFKNERAATDIATSSGFTFQVALPLPLWDRNRGATDAARAQTRKLEAVRDELHRNVAREVEQAWRMLTAAAEQLDALRPFMGREAQLALRAAETAYTEGEISLVEWLDAVRAYHEAQSSFAAVQTDHLIRQIALERAIGADFPKGLEQ